MAVKRTTIILIAVIAVSIISISEILFLAYENNQNEQIDTSWIEPLNNMLENAVPLPEEEAHIPEATLAYCRVFLHQNGTSEFIEYGSIGNNNTNPVGTALNNLLMKADLELKLSRNISNEQFERVLADDKVVEISYRGATLQFGGQKRFYLGYFILHDNLNENLAGRIIAAEVGKQGYSLCAISK